MLSTIRLIKKENNTPLRFIDMKELKYTLIKNRKQYNEYATILEDLVFSKNKTKDMKNEIELLTLLIEKWDEEHNTLRDVDPVTLLKYLMVENNINQTELVSLLGITKGLVSEILNYKKGMSKEVIRKLSARFKVSQEAFNKSYPLETNRNTKKVEKKNTPNEKLYIRA